MQHIKKQPTLFSLLEIALIHDVHIIFIRPNLLAMKNPLNQKKFTKVKLKISFLPIIFSLVQVKDDTKFLIFEEFIYVLVYVNVCFVDLMVVQFKPFIHRCPLKLSLLCFCYKLKTTLIFLLQEDCILIVSIILSGKYLGHLKHQFCSTCLYYQFHRVSNACIHPYASDVLIDPKV